MTDGELAELVGAIGNVYVRRGLSPPSQLRGAARHWLGLDVHEILGAIDAHFDQHRRLYVSGSGDGYFWMVEAAIRKAWEAKHPPRDRVDDEPVPPRRRRGVRRIYTAAGVADVIVDGGPTARLLRNQGSNVERPSGLGYESAGARSKNLGRGRPIALS